MNVTRPASRALLCAVALLATGPLPASASIQAVSVGDGALVITGQSFGTAVKPVVMLGGSSLAVTSFQAGSVTATLPAQLGPGSYALTLRTYSTSTRSTIETFVVTVGAAGPAGPAGPTGPAGPAGSAGQSVLAVPLAVGSAACPTGGSEFLAGAGYTTACNGSDGAAGATGPQGPQGPIGSQGAQGPEGAPGPQGPEGARGVAGPIGPTGPQGVPGEAGHGAYWVDQNGKFVGVSTTLFPYITWSDAKGVLWGLNPEQVAVGMWSPTAGGIYKSGTIEYFETADCSGTAYVLANPTMTSTYYRFSYWYRPPTAQARLFAPVAARNWYTGQGCIAASPGSGFYLDASLLVSIPATDDVVAELRAQGFVPPFRIVVR